MNRRVQLQQHTFNVRIDLGIRKADHGDTVDISQILSSFRIIPLPIRMLASVDLHRKVAGVTEEIEHVRPYGVLASEMYSEQVIPKLAPQYFFLRGTFFTKGAGTRNITFVRFHRKSIHRVCILGGAYVCTVQTFSAYRPSPPTLSRGERGAERGPISDQKPPTEGEGATGPARTCTQSGKFDHAGGIERTHTANHCAMNPHPIPLPEGEGVRRDLRERVNRPSPQPSPMGRGRRGVIRRNSNCVRVRRGGRWTSVAHHPSQGHPAPQARAVHAVLSFHYSP